MRGSSLDFTKSPVNIKDVYLYEDDKTKFAKNSKMQQLIVNNNEIKASMNDRLRMSQSINQAKVIPN